jgi:selenide,water dikinase
MEQIRLTQFSPGAGCGCKISPAELEKILKHSDTMPVFKNLLVGHESRDDGAVLDIGDNNAIISTADFFTPIVDDPYDYGRIAAANALSDIYAMGGSPLMAISILGWPVEKLPADMAATVINGAIEICSEAEIPLAGGHSISISDPVFGLAVTGIVNHSFVKRNDTATEGCQLFLSKPLGIGILSTAAKKCLLTEDDYKTAVHWMTMLNRIGTELGRMKEVKAMTDVTGFGLLGHLFEICRGSGLSAIIDPKAIPLMDNIHSYIEKNCIPGGTYRNWKSYGSNIINADEFQKLVMADPQTSGGLLIAVDINSDNTFKEICDKFNFANIGYLEKPSEGKPMIIIK